MSGSGAQSASGTVPGGFAPDAAGSGTREPVRALLLIGSLARAGAENQARLLLTRMPAGRVALRLACLHGHPEQLEAVTAAGIPTDILPPASGPFWRLRMLRHLRSLVLRHRIEVVQTFLSTFDILGPCLRLLVPGVPVVTSRRNMDENLRPREVRLLRITNRLATLVVGNSEAAIASVRRMEGLPAARLRVIPNGIELPPAVEPPERAKAREAFGLGDADFAVVYLAHFRRQKGHAYIPEVARRVVRDIPTARFLVGGNMEGSRQIQGIVAAVKDEIDRFDLRSHVTLLGRLSPSRPLLAAADLFLSLSDVEGMSNSVMEAMSLGLPVVATRAGGNAELIRDNRDGWLVPIGDVPAAAELLVRLARDPQARAQAGRSARERIPREFSTDVMVERYASLYEEICRR